MRKTVTISMSEEMHDYLIRNSGYVTVSEYIRSLVRRDQEERAALAVRPLPRLRRANDAGVFYDALIQVEKLKAILEQKEVYDD
jgi:Arc/MetJ-type ribon-helix-helix transcriptional regulator